MIYDFTKDRPHGLETGRIQLSELGRREGFPVIAKKSLRADAKTVRLMQLRIGCRKHPLLEMNISHLLIHDSSLWVQIRPVRPSLVPVKYLTGVVWRALSLKPGDSKATRWLDVRYYLAMILVEAVVSHNAVNALPLVKLLACGIPEYIFITLRARRWQHKGMVYLGFIAVKREVPPAVNAIMAAQNHLWKIMPKIAIQQIQVSMPPVIVSFELVR